MLRAVKGGGDRLQEHMAKKTHQKPGGLGIGLVSCLVAPPQGQIRLLVKQFPLIQAFIKENEMPWLFKNSYILLECV